MSHCEQQDCSKQSLQALNKGTFTDWKLSYYAKRVSNMTLSKAPPSHFAVCSYIAQVPLLSIMRSPKAYVT